MSDADRPSVEDFLLQASTLQSTGRIEEAAHVLNGALNYRDYTHAISYQLALLEAERCDWSAAERYARICAASGDNEYASGLGQVFAKAGKYGEAQAWLLRGLTFNPNDVRALTCLGAIYAEQRKTDEALACIDKALSIQPDFPPALFCRQRMHSERTFLDTVRAAYVEFARKNGLVSDPDMAGQTEIEFPTAFTDLDGNPRFKMWIPSSLVLSDLGAAHLFYREVAGGGYEASLRRFLDAHLKSDDVFIDVGAHWGIHTLTAATILPHHVSVVAIEPHPENSARLRDWVERNGLGADVLVVPNAAGEHVGVASMRVDGSSMGHSLRTHGHETDRSNTVEVSVITLDQVINNHANLQWRPVILKLDVEGFELEVLSGARELLSSGDVVALIWESGNFYEHSLQAKRTELIFDLLNSYGFKHFCMVDGGQGARLVPLQNKYQPGDVFSLAPGFDRI